MIKILFAEDDINLCEIVADYFAEKSRGDMQIICADSRETCDTLLKELFYTIEILDEAISKGRKVEFTYNSYDVDKKLHPRRKEKYVVNPYQIAATNGRYYLICNYDKYDDISN